MEHLLHFMVPGTELLNLRKDFMWLLYLSKTENHQGNGKYLQMVFPEALKILLPEVPCTVPAALPKDLMVPFM